MHDQVTDLIPDGLPRYPTGIPPDLQPYCPVNITEESFWEIVGHVNRVLKQHGYHEAAAEFRAFAQVMEHDLGMLCMLVMSYVRDHHEEE